MGRIGPRNSRGLLVCAGFVAAVLIFVGWYVAAGSLGRSVSLLVVGLVPIAAIAVGLRINRVTDRLPWLLVMLGLALLAAVNATWLIKVGLGGAADAESAGTRLLQAGGYLGLLAASVVVVLRHAPHDSGGVIDAALIGVGAAAPVWEFLLRPRLLDGGVQLAGQSVVLVQTLALFAILGSLLRISRTAGQGRGALRFLFGSLASTLLGLVLSVAVADPGDARQLPYAGICWVLGYLCLAGAGLHPSATHFTRPTGWRRTGPTRVRFWWLGTFLLLNPVVGAVPQMRGDDPDTLLLCIGPVLVIPLVLTRIGQMVRQHEQDQRRLAHQATHDELTGMPNRRHLFALIDQALRRGAGGAPASVAVLFCDLNDFKPVNDRFGHDAGDHLLQTVARRLAGCLRPGDVAGRIGGDEFLVLCPGADRAAAERVGARIEEALRSPVRWGRHEVRVGVAVGVAVCDGDTGWSADALVAVADQAMYRHKRAGRQAGPAAAA